MSNVLHPRDAFPNLVENLIEPVLMVALNVLQIIRQIFTRSIQVLLSAGRGERSGLVRDEIGQVPAFEELPEGDDSWMLLEVP